MTLYPQASESREQRVGRVVLIDDSELIREIISERLAAAGWAVRSADSGESALGLIRSWLPDVVICDLHMPGMAGFEVIRAINSADSMIPVVILSRDDDVAVVLQAVREGAFDYVVKQGDEIGALEAAIERAAAHSRLGRENLRLTQALADANRALEERVRELHEQHQLLAQSQQRSASLLRNILPDAVASRLLADGGIIADRFTDVTVLFADIVGFTPLAAACSPIELVEILNDIVSEFDLLVERHGLEKIKTIGDAYMAAAGLPVPCENHAEVAAAMALDMLDVIEAWRAEHQVPLGLRIGMHSGPVVAGVIGTKKFSYDVWGDTVNVASRMESSGVPGRIQVTDETRRLLAPRFALEERGLIEVKGKGQIATWFLLPPGLS
ncbi:MAG: hypothetical protein Tsb0020_49210 [Haliangiales bacterium]